MKQESPPVRLDQATEEPATKMPDNVEHRQIVYRVLFDRPATARRLAAVAGACRFVWNENRVILATGWSGRRAMLAYKAPRLIAVDPRHTSQTCAACGQTHAAPRRSQASFECVACGHADHADLNAARDIRRRGLAQLHGKERTGWPTPVIRETDRRLAA